MSTPDPACPTPPRTPAQPEERHLTIRAVVESNMGDHAEFIARPVRYVPGEDLEALVLRAFPALNQAYGRHGEGDHLVIQVTPGADESTWRGNAFEHWRSPQTKADAELPPF